MRTKYIQRRGRSPPSLTRCAARRSPNAGTPNSQAVFYLTKLTTNPVIPAPMTANINANSPAVQDRNRNIAASPWCLRQSVCTKEGMRPVAARQTPQPSGALQTLCAGGVKESLEEVRPDDQAK